MTTMLALGDYVEIVTDDGTKTRGSVLAFSPTMIKLVEMGVEIDVDVSTIKATGHVYDSALFYIRILYTAVIVLNIAIIVLWFMAGFSVWSTVPFFLIIVLYIWSLFCSDAGKLTKNEDIIAVGYRGGLFALYILVIFALYEKLEKNYGGNKMAFRVAAMASLGLSLLTAVDLLMTENCAALFLYAKYSLHTMSMSMVASLLIEFLAKYKHAV